MPGRTSYGPEYIYAHILAYSDANKGIRNLFFAWGIITTDSEGFATISNKIKAFLYFWCIQAFPTGNIREKAGISALARIGKNFCRHIF